VAGFSVAASGRISNRCQQLSPLRRTISRDDVGTTVLDDEQLVRVLPLDAGAAVLTAAYRSRRPPEWSLPASATAEFRRRLAALSPAEEIAPGFPRRAYDGVWVYTDDSALTENLSVFAGGCLARVRIGDAQYLLEDADHSTELWPLSTATDSVDGTEIERFRRIAQGLAA
jgi:hypothetical protein